ncbi:hypothetical protein EJ110_NYTH17467 [Nymphaea thermarum]|nr:hypothetical protein EJ110_NYTH17467 [Nymphaea thermarum]
MAEPPPPRLMNFVSEHQLDEARRTRGERVEDGTAQRDKPLYQILKENKDKRDAEFNERFKHRPPKALDEDETEFLDNWEMSKRQYEQEMANDEAQQLQSFQEAVAARASVVYELKVVPSESRVEEPKPVTKKNPPGRPFGNVVMVKPLKKQKTDAPDTNLGPTSRASNTDEDKKSSAVDATKPQDTEEDKNIDGNTSLCALVSYSDESEDDSG